ncbi:hypothetical protein RFI_06959, partial [Reticulomyxa filosa]
LLSNHLCYISPLFRYFYVRGTIEDTLSCVGTLDSLFQSSISTVEKVKMPEIMDMSTRALKDFLKPTVQYMMKPEAIKLVEEKYLLYIVLGQQTQLCTKRLLQLQCIKLPPDRSYLEMLLDEDISFDAIHMLHHCASLRRYDWSFVIAFLFHLTEFFDVNYTDTKLTLHYAKRATSLLDNHLTVRTRCCNFISISLCLSFLSAIEMLTLFITVEQHSTGDADRTRAHVTTMHNEYSLHQESEVILPNHVINELANITGIKNENVIKLYANQNFCVESFLLSFFKSKFLAICNAKALELDEFDVAFDYAVEFDDWKSVQTRVTKYISECCKKQKTEAILKFDWNNTLSSSMRSVEDTWMNEMLSMKQDIWVTDGTASAFVEEELLKNARNNVVLSPLDSHYYDLLWMYYMGQNNNQKASQYMLEYALHIEMLIKHKNKKCIGSQKLAVARALSTLQSSDSSPNSFLYLKTNPLIDHYGGTQQHPWLKLFDSKLKRIITLDGIQKLHVLLSCTNNILYGGHSDISMNLSHLSPSGIASKCIQQTLFEDAITLAKAFNLDMVQIFNEICLACLYGKDSGLFTKMNTLLLQYDSNQNGFQCMLHVFKTLLLLDNRTPVLPCIQIAISDCLSADEYSHSHQPRSIDTLLIPLVRLLCEFDRVVEAVRLVVSVLNNNASYHSMWKLFQELAEYCKKRNLAEAEKILFEAVAKKIFPPLRKSSLEYL